MIPCCATAHRPLHTTVFRSLLPFGVPRPRCQVTAEGCKNLLLAGVSAVLQDDAAAQPVDIGANFLLDGQDVGKNVSVRRRTFCRAAWHGRRG